MFWKMLKKREASNDLLLSRMKEAVNEIREWDKSIVGQTGMHAAIQITLAKILEKIPELRL